MTTQEILQNCDISGLVVKLPEIKLERNEYLEVKKSLELIGGKWKGGRTQGFVFEEDPAELLAQLASGEQRNLKKEYQFFPTPPDVVEIMMNYLPVIGPKYKILEPSAGDGALIKGLLGSVPYFDGTIDCFELMDLNRTKLSKLKQVQLLGDDFLQCNLKDTYDFILANPPFTGNQDIDHIGKMFECCEPGGHIFTLASTSWVRGTQKKQMVFKQWLDDLNAEQEEIPAGYFKESGTGVATMFLRIVKPVDAAPIPWETKAREKVMVSRTDLKLTNDISDNTLVEIDAPKHTEQTYQEPAVLLQQMKAIEKEISTGLESLEKMLSPKKSEDMDFFQQLAQLGNVDLTIRIMQKNDTLTLNVMPGSGTASIKPILITGTAAELDADFFTSIMPGVNEVAGIVSNLAEVKEEAEKKAAEEKEEKVPVQKNQPDGAKRAATAEEKAKAKKKLEKKQAPEKAVIEETALFPGE